ncbi:hypothetical protein SAMN02745116_02330 [Pilibacter termitis]|uniref:Uncharacterized protein n=1 Tax=Pilibacter termitis TaxID=263852 RepID=A0A1T4QUT9_9ENTE|nr:hypothetical protein [Pilibacter termitis]SKA07559.1 hypothetical protein SAMN02745116_02330 [Pilibacter termitis]
MSKLPAFVSKELIILYEEVATTSIFSGDGTIPSPFNETVETEKAGIFKPKTQPRYYTFEEITIELMKRGFEYQSSSIARAVGGGNWNLAITNRHVFKRKKGE